MEIKTYAILFIWQTGKKFLVVHNKSADHECEYIQIYSNALIMDKLYNLDEYPHIFFFSLLSDKFYKLFWSEDFCSNVVLSYN